MDDKHGIRSAGSRKFRNGLYDCTKDFVRLRLSLEDGDADCADQADFCGSFGGLAATSF